MSGHYPRVRHHGPIAGEDRIIARESIQMVFYLPFDHREIGLDVEQALEAYCHVVGLSPQTICSVEDANPDGDSSYSLLEDEGWQRIREWMRPSTTWRFMEELDEDSWFFNRKVKFGCELFLAVTGPRLVPTGYSFEYKPRLPWREHSAGSVSQLVATVPTEFLEERGPGQVRELAMEMAERLPFATGHAGLAMDFARVRRKLLPQLKETLFRHPGLHVDTALTEWFLGFQVEGVHWLNFLGPRVLGAVGGMEGLRSQLHAPETSVQAMDGGRALVTLGTWPEAGDLNQGDPLPAYRELARVLEPWLQPVHLPPWPGYTEDEYRRWWRRFLD